MVILKQGERKVNVYHRDEEEKELPLSFGKKEMGDFQVIDSDTLYLAVICLIILFYVCLTNTRVPVVSFFSLMGHWVTSNLRIYRKSIFSPHHPISGEFPLIY